MAFGVDDLIALIALAAGTGLTAASNAAATREQGRRIQSATEAAAAKQKLGLQQITDNAKQFDARQRLQTYDQTAQQQGQDLVNALNKARGDNPTTTPTDASTGIGHVSDSLLAENAGRTAQRASGDVALAKLLGRYRGIGQLQFNEGLSTGDAAARAAPYFNDAQSIFNSGQQQAAFIHPNEGVKAIGALLAAYGSAGLMGGAIGSGWAQGLTPAVKAAAQKTAAGAFAGGGLGGAFF